MASPPPDPRALDWLEQRLDALDTAPLIADLPAATVENDLRELGLDPARLALPTAHTAARATPGAPVPTASDDGRRLAGAGPSDRPARARSGGVAPRWRAAVIAGVGILALVLASSALLRALRDVAPGSKTDAAGEVYKGEAQGPSESPSGATSPAAPARSPAEQLLASRRRLDALVAAPTDTAGAGAAISDVRRAYDEARQFEAIAGAPVDPSLSSVVLGRQLAAAYTALGRDDLARTYAP